MGRYLDRRPEPTDILSCFAGVRPLLRGRLGSKTSRLSREHAVVVSDSGLVTVTGGKWTTYRRMAIDAVDQAARVGDLPVRPSVTAELPLHGWQERDLSGENPMTVYGSDSVAIEKLCSGRPEWNQPLHTALPYRAVEVVWAARYEAARSVHDVLARRTRALFLDARASIEAAPLVATLLATELGRSQDWEKQQLDEYVTIAERYLPMTTRRERKDYEDGNFS